MSGAAEAYVETLAVKGSARELLRTIAKHISEGQTTTPPMTIDELAAATRRDEKTVRRHRDALIAAGVIRVLDGGRGNVARYEILNLAGTRPITAAPLPLLGRPKPPRTKQQRSTSDIVPDLFDSTSDILPDVRAYTIGHFARRWMFILTNIGHFARRFLPPWRRLVRARDVHTFKEVHTHAAAPRDGPPMTVHPWHAWCGLVCVPKDLDQEFQRKGHEAAWLLAFYARTCSALPAGEKIHVNDFTFWRAALKGELATATPNAGPRRDIPNSRPCPHQPRCVDGEVCVDRSMAEWRQAQERKSQSG